MELPEKKLSDAELDIMLAIWQSPPPVQRADLEEQLQSHNWADTTLLTLLSKLVEKGYRIRRNGVSNYTLDKKSRVVFLGKIPDHTDDIKSTKDIPSWKRMCYCILKNDHNCRFMGFGLTRQQQRRIDIIRKKYKSVEAMENGV